MDGLVVISNPALNRCDMSTLQIYSDNAIEAQWFSSLHPIFSEAELHLIRGRGENPAVIEELIQYDRPDIILTRGSEALLVVEKTREVPTGHNVGQRVARLVKAVEVGVPTIKFFPFDAKKHGEHAGVCNLNVRLLVAFERMWSIHGSPIVAVNWQSDRSGELIDDGSEDNELKSIMRDFVESDFDADCSRFDNLRRASIREVESRVTERPLYGSPPPSVTFESTRGFLQRLGVLSDEQAVLQLLQLQESLVYRIGMTEHKCKRQDPYTGSQFIYDYAYCRTGPGVAEKSRNLILHFPCIRREVWEQCNPNRLDTKSCNWYLIANALVFSNGISVLR
jgi:hypothetical protein